MTRCGDAGVFDLWELVEALRFLLGVVHPRPLLLGALVPVRGHREHPHVVLVSRIGKDQDRVAEETFGVEVLLPGQFRDKARVAVLTLVVVGQVSDYTLLQPGGGRCRRSGGLGWLAVFWPPGRIVLPCRGLLLCGELDGSGRARGPRPREILSLRRGFHFEQGVCIYVCVCICVLEILEALSEERKIL